MLVTNIPCNGNFIVTYPFGVYDEKLNITSDHRHHGIDIVIENKIVVSASKGRVVFSGWNNQGYGNLVIVQNGEYQLFYAHLSKIFVKYGEDVDFITQIGVQGATGYVTGAHLHFEVRKNGAVINSADYMRIPNEYGNYRSYNYAYDYQENVTATFTNYKLNQLVVYDKFYNNDFDDAVHDCMNELGSWMQDYIKDIHVGAKNPYRLANGRYLRNENIKEVK